MQQTQHCKQCPASRSESGDKHGATAIQEHFYEEARDLLNMLPSNKYLTSRRARPTTWVTRGRTAIFTTVLLYYRYLNSLLCPSTLTGLKILYSCQYSVESALVEIPIVGIVGGSDKHELKTARKYNP